MRVANRSRKGLSNLFREKWWNNSCTYTGCFVVFIYAVMSTNDFYLRYYVGHKGKFGHEFLEFEFRPDGK